ncbi:MAG: methionine--tRNA ligase [Planctomycetes bacterium]|nr:methionine--tRNA ligase [Planctomycetota bacterium]
MARHLVTSALPYANGPLHFGHAVGAYLPGDVYVRTLRMLGEEVLYVCGADEYGTSITIGAEKAGQSYPAYVEHWRNEIRTLFDNLGIEFDVWSGTSISPHHEEMSQTFFRRLDEGGYLLRQTQDQFHCPKCERFLADRFVSGICYVCDFENARGDECPKCGTWLETLRLKDPRCKICGSKPEGRATTHWYLDLPKLRDEHIGAWFESKSWKPNVEAFVRAQLADLKPRPITRDLDWGVPVPEDLAHGEEGKVLYVWFDAPIGYLSFSREWADKTNDPEAWKRYWCSDDTRLVHFIGKDNIPFHCLIFPSMLWGQKQGFVLPDTIPANEFLNLQGRKFSTSEHWTIPLDEFFGKYDMEATRFYLLSNMPETSDAEWRWEDYQRCVNASLADTIGNLVTRVLRFAAKHWDGKIPPLNGAHRAELDRSILTECGTLADPAQSIRGYRFRRACEELVANAACANVFIDRHAPWALRKEDPARAASVLNTACEWILWIARWMPPFMPHKAQTLWSMLGQEGAVSDLGWPGIPEKETWRTLKGGTPLGTVEALFQKLTDDEIAAEIQALQNRSQMD